MNRRQLLRSAAALPMAGAHAECHLHGVGRRATSRQRRNAGARGTRHEQRTKGLTCCRAETSPFGTPIAALHDIDALQPPFSTTWRSRRWQPAAWRKNTRRQHAAQGITSMKTILFLLLSASAMLAQVVPGRYILELSGDPAAVAAIQQGARSSARTAAIAEIGRAS